MMKTITNCMIALLAIVAFSSCKQKEDTNSGLTISQTSIIVSESGDEKQITVNAAGAWKAEVEDEAREWLKISPAVGSGGATIVKIMTSPIIAGETTSAKITFSLADGLTKVEVDITRGPATYGRTTDSLALAALYANTNKKEATWKLRWKLDQPITTWEKVVTEVIDGQVRVVALNLAEIGLHGTMPSAMGYLSELRVLDLRQIVPVEGMPQKYALSGPIPVEMGALPNLQRVNLSYNKLTGSIPEGFFTNKNLISFDLTSNMLDGVIPATLPQAENLSYLSLGLNKLTGSIPSDIAKLTKIGYLNLSQNKLAGTVPSFNALKALRHLDISYNAQYVDSLVNNPDLMSYVFKKHKSGGFSGTVAVDGLPEVTFVNLSGCQFETSPKITNCPKVDSIFIADNTTLKTLDASIFNQPSCTGMFINNSGLTALPEVTNLSKVVTMYANHNELTTLPDSFRKITAIKVLELNANKFVTLPDVFTDMQSLKYLYLAYGKLQSLPPSLWKLSGLLALHLQVNEIVGELPTSLEGFSSCREFNVSFNQFTGSLASLGDLAQVQLLLITANKFNGTLPDFTNLKMLSAVGADDNYITGTIPASLINCKNLGTLHLFNNCLDGEIAVEVMDNMKSQWCNDWKPYLYILPQRTGYKLEMPYNPCLK